MTLKYFLRYGEPFPPIGGLRTELDIVHLDLPTAMPGVVLDCELFAQYSSIQDNLGFVPPSMASTSETILGASNHAIGSFFV